MRQAATCLLTSPRVSAAREAAPNQPPRTRGRAPAKPQSRADHPLTPRQKVPLATQARVSLKVSTPPFSSNQALHLSRLLALQIATLRLIQSSREMISFTLLQMRWCQSRLKRQSRLKPSYQLRPRTESDDLLPLRKESVAASRGRDKRWMPLLNL